MQRKRKQESATLNRETSYLAKARYYERYSTQELLDTGRLVEIGVRAYPRQTEMLSVRVDKTLLAQLQRVARKKKIPLRTLIRQWLVKHSQEEVAA